MRYALFFLTVVVAAGCGDRGANDKSTPSLADRGKTIPRLADREKIARQLPADLKLEDRIPREVGNASKGDPNPDKRRTVEQTLVDVGGHLDKAGTLVDGEGWPIVFKKQHIEGTPPPPRTFTDKEAKDKRSPEEKEWDELRATRRIIIYEYRIDK